MTQPPPALRISLREFLLLFTAIVIGCAALRYASEYWLAGVSLITLLAFIALAVVALVDRGGRRAAAIGFVAGVGIYLAVVLSMRVTGDKNGNMRTYNAELDPDSGWLPTTLALRPLYNALHDHWFSDPSGAPIRQSDVPAVFQTASGQLGGGYAYLGERPNRAQFMLTAHCLWALLFGYGAAKFARWVYARRLREQQSKLLTTAAG